MKFLCIASRQNWGVRLGSLVGTLLLASCGSKFTTDDSFAHAGGSGAAGDSGAGAAGTGSDGAGGADSANNICSPETQDLDCAHDNPCLGRGTCTSGQECEWLSPLAKADWCGDEGGGYRLCDAEGGECVNSECGDKMVDPRTEEQCDDGNDNETDKCTTDCKRTCAAGDTASCENDGDPCTGILECKSDKTCDYAEGYGPLAEGARCDRVEGGICLQRASGEFRCEEETCTDGWPEDQLSGQPCDTVYNSAGCIDNGDGNCSWTCAPEAVDECSQRDGCYQCEVSGGLGKLTPEARRCLHESVVPAPADDLCAITDMYGVFVSAELGSDTDPTGGSPERPFKSLSFALQQLQERESAGQFDIGGEPRPPRLYVCADSDGDGKPGNEETYREALVVKDAASALELFGGFRCQNLQWEYDETLRSRVEAPPTGGNLENALRVSGGTASLTIAGFEFRSPSATHPSGSSMAAFISGRLANAPVEFSAVTLSAGKGANGTDGIAEGSNWFEGKLDGNDGNSGRMEKTCLCEDNDPAASFYSLSRGGLGGEATSGAMATDGARTPEGSSSPNENNAGHSGTCSHGTTGSRGDDGAHGRNAAALGTLSAAGWQPASGGTGRNGTPGQGGGGGGYGASGTGGGGACGGCGGLGARGATSGGASVALAVVASRVHLSTTCVLTAEAGGKGGDGAKGQRGGPGGGGGSGTLTSCNGGSGAEGGWGGTAGAGAGGVSLAILYSGEPEAKPTGIGAEVDVKAPGAPGSDAGATGVIAAQPNNLYFCNWNAESGNCDPLY